MPFRPLNEAERRLTRERISETDKSKESAQGHNIAVGGVEESSQGGSMDFC